METNPPAIARVLTPARQTAFWSRPWVRNTIMVVAFAAVMLIVNSIASSLGNPIASLLIGPALGIGVLWLYAFAVRRLEKRPVIELDRTHARRRLLRGVLGGTALAVATIGVLALLGGYQITGWGSVSGALTVVGMMCAVAVAEEVLFRGVILRLVQQRWGTWVALATSALLFGLLHLVNPGATLWGGLAIAVEAGLMLGAAFVATGSLWLPIGIHLGWNVAIAAILGTVTSGAETGDALVNAVTTGPAWLTGGEFGPEASVIAIVVCSIVTWLLLAHARRNGRIGARPRRR